jgi:hypothetical protein
MAALLTAWVVLAAPAGAERPRPGSGLEPPRLLPDDTETASLAARADSWLVGARPGAVSERIARRFGAHVLMEGTGVYRLDSSRARGFAAALRVRGRYVFSEPDRVATARAFPVDPLFGSQWGLAATGAIFLDPPPVSADSPLLAIVEDGIDPSHPDLQGVAVSGPVGRDPENVSHGTAVTSVASAPANGVGITGVWPGARTLAAIARPSTCGGTVKALDRAERAGAAVINMSYGFDGGCFAHYVATQRLFGAGVVLVAAAGNEFLEGNPADSNPAVDPHVITVAGLDPDLSSADFSNENNAIDVSAAASGVLAAVPPALDADGVQDGYEAVDGTSFASPIVAAGTAWVQQERPALDHTQLADLIRYNAVDLGRRGWDKRFGFGRFDLPKALRAAPPRPDPLEPNENISWINGKFFAPDAPIYRGRASRLSARVDRLEDPFDVYRVVVPGRRSVRITVRPLFGDLVLEAYSAFAKTVLTKRERIGISDRPGRRVEMLDVSNPRGGRIKTYVSVWPNTLDAGYRLALRPSR